MAPAGDLRARVVDQNNRPVEDAVRVMSEHDFSQISITRDGRVIGTHPVAEVRLDQIIGMMVGRAQEWLQKIRE